MSEPVILVTGATGNIGRALVQRLSSAGARVIAGSPSGESVAGAPGRVVRFDDPASLKTAFEGVERLFLLLPLVPGKVELARNAVDAAKAAGVRFLLRSSGAGADPQSPVAVARLQGEIDQLVIDSGIDHALVRPNSFMQNFIQFYGGMIKAGTVYLSHADGRSSFIDVADIAAVDAAILQDPQAHVGNAYTVTGPQALSAREALDAIGAEIGRRIDYVPVPEEAAVASMKQMGMDDWTVGILSSLNQVIANGWAAEVSPAVQQITGRAPRSFAQFVSDNVAAWR